MLRCISLFLCLIVSLFAEGITTFRLSSEGEVSSEAGVHMEQVGTGKVQVVADPESKMHLLGVTIQQWWRSTSTHLLFSAVGQPELKAEIRRPTEAELEQLNQGMAQLREAGVVGEDFEKLVFVRVGVKGVSMRRLGAFEPVVMLSDPKAKQEPQLQMMLSPSLKVGETKQAFLIAVEEQAPFGNLIKAVHTLNAYGCEAVVLLVSDVIAQDLDASLDDEVKPTVAYSAVEADTKGKIVIYVDDDGSVSGVGKLPLQNAESITEYVAQQKKLLLLLGEKEPKVYLRGSKAVLFKHARKVIKAASKAGVSSVVFSAK